MAKKERYTIRNMTEDEVESVAVAWAAKEGWNPGLYDAPCFYATDPKGFFVGLLDDEPISCISAVAYDQDFAFLGFYIVKPEHRGKGYGLKIWNAAIAYLQAQNIGLDGVIEQQPNYMKSGFKLAYSNIRYEGTAKSTAERFPEIIRLSEVSSDDISLYDTNLFPVPRPQFLQCWVQQPVSLAIVAMQDKRVAGYGVIRRCRSGYKIGPLFADTKDLANKLFLALNNFVKPGTKIYLDTPEINQAAVELAEGHGMHKVFETARMYTKSQPNVNINKIFGVTTFEIG
ncbi:GNAT family N-acetyltransferase [archaeon]|nr:MAG: GNAT family N-acetyltransferase [archaeon]